jgi:hypothetical protein
VIVKLAAKRSLTVRLGPALFAARSWVQAGKVILGALLRRRQFFLKSREARSVERAADGGGDAVGVEARRKPPGKLLPSADAVDRELCVITALHGRTFR